MAGTKAGKVVGWQLQPAAYEETVPTPVPSPVPAAEEAVEPATTATPDAPPPKPEGSPPHVSGHKGPNSFSKRCDGAGAAATRGVGAPPEKGGSGGSNTLEQGGRQNRRGRVLPPVNLVSDLFSVCCLLLFVTLGLSSTTEVDDAKACCLGSSEAVLWYCCMASRTPPSPWHLILSLKHGGINDYMPNTVSSTF